MYVIDISNPQNPVLIGSIEKEILVKADNDTIIFSNPIPFYLWSDGKYIFITNFSAYRESPSSSSTLEMCILLQDRSIKIQEEMETETEILPDTEISQINPPEGTKIGKTLTVIRKTPNLLLKTLQKVEMPNGRIVIGEKKRPGKIGTLYWIGIDNLRIFRYF
jgi:hypothetical protein